jgi:kynurenine 3-monooxygenase
MPASQKIAIVGAGPVGSLAALYAAQRGFDVEVYELRPGELPYTAARLGINISHRYGPMAKATMN